MGSEERFTSHAGSVTACVRWELLLLLLKEVQVGWHITDRGSFSGPVYK